MISAILVGESAVYTVDYEKAKNAAKNLFKLIDRKSKSDLTQGFIPDTCNGDIAFKKVHFHYPARPEAKVLTGFSLKVHKGQTVAFVGSSGCGKSTSLQLLLKFYDCDSGRLVRVLC
jgi:ABC-type multidrug transport system fused ATPase/permease subunit